MCFFFHIVTARPVLVHSLIAQHVKYANRNALSMFRALNIQMFK